MRIKHRHVAIGTFAAFYPAVVVCYKLSLLSPEVLACLLILKGGVILTSRELKGGPSSYDCKL